MLKGARTVIAAPGRAARPWRRSRIPAWRRAAPGDVLGGTIGALLAQGLAPYDAARLGVYLHGTAGDVLRERLGDAGLLAGDLPLEIALARKRLAAMAKRRSSSRRLGFRAFGDGPGADPGS